MNVWPDFKKSEVLAKPEMDVEGKLSGTFGPREAVLSPY